MRRLLSLLLVSVLSVGCAAADEDLESSEDALSAQTLTAAGCKTPSLTTKPMKTTSGAVIEGSAITTIAGCIVGKPGEAGKDTSARLTTLLGNTDAIGKVKGADGKPIFAKFTAGAKSGNLASGLVQDVDVTLQMTGSPTSKLRIVRKLGADGVYTVNITNVTPFKAKVLLFPVTAIEAGNLSLDVKASPAANGLTITGTGEVELEVMKEEANAASGLVSDLFGWLTTELAR